MRHTFSTTISADFRYRWASWHRRSFERISSYFIGHRFTIWDWTTRGISCYARLLVLYQVVNFGAAYHVLYLIQMKMKPIQKNNRINTKSPGLSTEMLTIYYGAWHRINIEPILLRFYQFSLVRFDWYSIWFGRFEGFLFEFFLLKKDL